MNKNHGTVNMLPIALMILLLTLAATLVLGQGGTGRENTNANSNKKAPASKRTTTPSKPTKTKPATAAANSNTSKPDESAANERTYWESIKNSTDPEDFNSYLKRYPNGQYADLARNSLRRLEAAKSKIELVLIPAGSFMMGSTNGSSYEKPVHQVTINHAFYIGKYEVTQAQWQSVMGSNPSSFKYCGSNCPVEQVSWDDAQNFIQRLNGMNDGYTYRLPTEAEWEYACRAGTTGDYAGDLYDMAWYSSNSGSKTHPVGTKQPNGFGLYDMHGNVREWCRDGYDASYYASSPATDPQGPPTGYLRVLRGGSWYDRAWDLGSGVRGSVAPDVRNFNNGFRVVAVR